MYRESISRLHALELEIKQEREERAQLAKKAIADAHEDGEARLREAAEQAEAEVKQRLREVNERAMAQAAERASSTENKKAVLEVRAERNMDRAAALIIEKIVKG